MYTTQAKIQSAIPAPILNEALDDDRDGQADDGVLDTIIATASQAIDGFLAGRYAVPFADPAPAIVAEAAFVFSCELIYQRRELTGDKNPMTKRADMLRDLLKKIASGDMQLDVTLSSVLLSGGDPGIRNPGRIVP